MSKGTDRIKAKDIFYAMIAESEFVIMSIINPLFIGRNIGPSGLAAYEIVATVFYFLYAIILSMTSGVEAICAKDIGVGNHDRFQRHKNSAYSWTILLCAVLALVLALLSDTLAEFLSEDGGELLCGYVADGIDAVALMAIPLAFFAIANCLLYFEEKRQLLYLDIVYYGVLILASVYISRTQPSMWGYIMADTVAFVVADLYIIGYFVLKRRKSKAVYSSINLKFRDIRDTFFTGLPNGVDYVLSAVAEIILNLYLLDRFSSDVVAAIGVTEGINNVPALVAEGLQFFAMSVFGRSVGRLIASDSEHTRERQAELSRMLMKVFRTTAIIAFSIGVAFAVFARPLTGLFLEPGESEAVRELTVRMTVLYSLGFGFAVLNWVLIYYFQVVSAYFLAHIATFAEEILFYLLLYIALGELFGIDGIVAAMLLSYIFLFLFNLCLVWWANRRFPRRIDDFRLDRCLDRLKEKELSAKKVSV